MWNIFFKKKEKKMPTPSTTATKQLQQTIATQHSQIGALQTRINTLSDQLAVLTQEVKDFKKNVATDVNELFEKIS